MFGLCIFIFFKKFNDQLTYFSQNFTRNRKFSNFWKQRKNIWIKVSLENLNFQSQFPKERK